MVAKVYMAPKVLKVIRERADDEFIGYRSKVFGTRVLLVLKELLVLVSRVQR